MTQTEINEIAEEYRIGRMGQIDMMSSYDLYEAFLAGAKLMKPEIEMLKDLLQRREERIMELTEHLNNK